MRIRINLDNPVKESWQETRMEVVGYQHDKPIHIAVPTPLLTEFDIHYSLNNFELFRWFQWAYHTFLHNDLSRLIVVRGVCTLFGPTVGNTTRTQSLSLKSSSDWKKRDSDSNSQSWANHFRKYHTYSMRPKPNSQKRSFILEGSIQKKTTTEVRY